MALTDPNAMEPGSIDETVAHLAVWARHAPRGFALVTFHSEFTRAEAARKLGDMLHAENIRYQEFELPASRTSAAVVRHLIERLDSLEPGVVSITGFATAHSDQARAKFLGALTLNRENLAEFNVRQIWWMTNEFADDFIRTAPDLASWFLLRLRLTESFSPTAKPQPGLEMIRSEGPAHKLNDALRRAASLVHRFHRAKVAGARSSELMQLAGWAADSLIEVGSLHQTRDLVDQLVAEVSDVFQSSVSEDRPTLHILNSLSRLLLFAGRQADAETLLQRGVAIAERLDATDDSRVAIELNNLASLLRECNRMREAEPLARRALDVSERLMGREHPDVASAFNNLGQLLQATNRAAEAEPLLRRALAISENTLGSEHPTVASALNNLAALLCDTNRLVEAEPLYRRALTIDERVLGPNHPNVAIRLNNLALLLQNTDRENEAEILLRRALAIDEQNYGPDHPKVAIRLNNLAGLLQEINRVDEAETLLHRALAISEQNLGTAHPITVTTLNNLASLLHDTNRLKDAEPLYRRALGGLYELSRGANDEHPNLRDAIDNYQRLLTAMGRGPVQIRDRLDEIGRARAATSSTMPNRPKT